VTDLGRFEFWTVQSYVKWKYRHRSPIVFSILLTLSILVIVAFTLFVRLASHRAPVAPISSDSTQWQKFSPYVMNSGGDFDRPVPLAKETISKLITYSNAPDPYWCIEYHWKGWLTWWGDRSSAWQENKPDSEILNGTSFDCAELYHLWQTMQLRMQLLRNKEGIAMRNKEKSGK
jgi:hypothetical protein